MPKEQEFIASDALERLESWMQMYGSDIINLAYSYVHNFHQAEDIAQDVFLRAMTKIDSFRGESSVKTWLLSITANRCKDYLRSWAKRHEVQDESPIERGVASQDTMSEVANGLENDALWGLVHQLPIKYREVIVMYYQRELSGQEIALILDTSEQSVRTKLHRARGLLKELMVKEGVWDEPNS